MSEATIDKLAKKLLENEQQRKEREREREKLCNELYQEKRMLQWAEEPAKLATRKQHAIAESLKEMARISHRIYI